ncbi:hypothetical protein BLOT_015420 [Blomia tropicalis]|nr:hypothetical protein BLOT_015420 [Blomia tropicalis]
MMTSMRVVTFLFVLCWVCCVQESEYQKTKLLAENKIAQMKRTGGSNLEEFESEFHNFVNNYQIMLKLMEQKPSFCEKLIEELDESIKYFATHQLKSETY